MLEVRSEDETMKLYINGDAVIVHEGGVASMTLSPQMDEFFDLVRTLKDMPMLNTRPGS
jgi:hypothetical protein